MSTFSEQLGIYASYHRDARNRATHFVGIPAIIFSLLVAAALWRIAIVGGSAAWILALLALAGWAVLDLTIGLAMIVVMLPLVLAAEWVASAYGATTAWIVFAVFFVGGWAFQLLGHVWEGRRPALVDNLFQAFIGPMFLMAEVLVALGLRRDLKAAIDGAPAATPSSAAAKRL